MHKVPFDRPAVWYYNELMKKPDFFSFTFPHSSFSKAAGKYFKKHTEIEIDFARTRLRKKFKYAVETETFTLYWDDKKPFLRINFTLKKDD